MLETEILKCNNFIESFNRDQSWMLNIMKQIFTKRNLFMERVKYHIITYNDSRSDDDHNYQSSPQENDSFKQNHKVLLSKIDSYGNEFISHYQTIINQDLLMQEPELENNNGINQEGRVNNAVNPEIQNNKNLSKIIASELIKELNELNQIIQGNNEQEMISEENSIYEVYQLRKKLNLKYKISLDSEYSIRQRYIQFLKINLKEADLLTQREKPQKSILYKIIFGVKKNDEINIKLSNIQKVQQLIYTLLVIGSLPPKYLNNLFILLRRFEFSIQVGFVFEEMEKMMALREIKSEGIQLLLSIMLNNAVFTQDWINISRVIISYQNMESNWEKIPKKHQIKIEHSIFVHPIFKLEQFWEGALYYIIQSTR